MKKPTLPVFLLITVLTILFVSQFFVGKVSAQDTKHLTCDEYINMVNTDACKYSAILYREKSLWCADTMDEIIKVEDGTTIYDASRMRSPDYYLDFDESCTAESRGQNASIPTNQNGQVKTLQTKSSASELDNWINNTFGAFNPNQLQVSRLPEVNNQDIFARASKITEKNMAEWMQRQEENKIKSPYTVEVINMETDQEPQIKYPDSNEYKPLGKGAIPAGSTVSSGRNAIVVGVGTSGLVFIKQDSEVTITHEGIDKAVNKGDAETNEFYLHKGELEVKTTKRAKNQDIHIQTDFVDLVVQSHFWVSQSLKETLVGVYEGKVAVSPRGSREATIVSPNGDKPGVVVVSQKFSVVKIAIIGVVLAAVIGTTIFFLKRKKKR